MKIEIKDKDGKTTLTGSADDCLKVLSELKKQASESSTMSFDQLLEMMLGDDD